MKLSGFTSVILKQLAAFTDIDMKIRTLMCTSLTDFAIRLYVLHYIFCIGYRKLYKLSC